MTYTNFISYYRNWLEKHSEFKFQPKNRQEQLEFGQMCMTYIRKDLKGGFAKPLPYNKSAPVPQDDEAELLKVVKQINAHEIKFDDELTF